MMNGRNLNSGPSDRAIAQAFREVTGPDGGKIGNDYVVDYMQKRAAEIDKETPPAGARDAERIADLIIKAPCGMEGSTIGDRILSEISWPTLRPSLVSAIEAALTGKADGGTAGRALCKCPCHRNFEMKHKPDGCYCKATQPAATGAGEAAWDIVAHDGKAYSPAEQDALRATNTAAPGMGDAIPDAETLRLRMGELTTEQVRIAQAAYRMALAAQPAPVVVDDSASDIPAWHLIEVAERLGAVRESSDDEMWWTVNLTTFYAIEKELHEAVNAHQYAQCVQPAPVVGGSGNVAAFRRHYPEGGHSGWYDAKVESELLEAFVPLVAEGLIELAYTHPALLSARPGGEDVELEAYDAGLLSDFGGGDVSWWQDYVRAELSRAHDHYQTQVAHPAQAGGES